MNRINAEPYVLNHMKRTSFGRPSPSWAVLLASLATVGLGSGPIQVAHAAPAQVPCNVSNLISDMANPNLDFLSLAEGCIYNLTVVNNSDPDGDNGLPVINKTLTIKGNGATIMRQSTPAVPKFRIFLVASAGELTLDELTVDNGDTSGVDAKAGRGGGISNHGTLKVINSTLSHNHGTFGGGGIGNGDPQEVPPPRTPGKLTLIDSVLFDNSGGIGGAIANGLNSTISLTGSAISDNTSISEGGAVASQGTATLDKCTISRNTTAGNGGGIVNGGQLFFTDSSVTGNSATGPVSSQLGFGGGILNVNGTVTLTRSDVTGNSANNDGGGFGRWCRRVGWN